MILRILIALLRVWGRLHRGDSLPAAQVRSVLVVELTRLGDVITMLPAVRLIAGYYDGANVTLLANEKYVPLLQGFSLPCKIAGVSNPDSMRGFIRAVRLARSLDIDLAISMSPPKRNAAVALWSGADRIVGYLRFVDSFTPYLESTPVESFRCSLHREERYRRDHIEERSLKVCRALGIETRSSSSEMFLDDGVLEERRHRLLSNGILPDKPFIAIHPFSGWEFRSWNINTFNAVVSRILEELGHDIIFVCEQKEEGQLYAAKQKFRYSRQVRFFPSNELLDTAVVFREADLVLCNDSGPLHLAAALGCKVIGLFGPAPPSLTAPRTRRGEFLYRHLECSPCTQRQCIRPSDSCMHQIFPEEVMLAVKKQLSVMREPHAVANA